MHWQPGAAAGRKGEGRRREGGRERGRREEAAVSDSRECGLSQVEESKQDSVSEQVQSDGAARAPGPWGTEKRQRDPRSCPR